MSDFHLECLQNEYLSRGVRTMSAVIVVTALGSEAVGQTVLRVWTPEDASVTTLKQMEPPLDLTGTRVVVNNLTGDYAMGSWHEESRDFALTVGFAKVVQQKKLAARVTLLVDGQPGEECLVIATPSAPKDPEGVAEFANRVGPIQLKDLGSSPSLTDTPP
jgi:hypothetical protein